jgi:hypothetical protein
MTRSSPVVRRSFAKFYAARQGCRADEWRTARFEWETSQFTVVK